MCNTGGKWQRVDLGYLYTRLSRIPRYLKLNFPWLMLLTYMFFFSTGYLSVFPCVFERAGVYCNFILSKNSFSFFRAPSFLRFSQSEFFS